MCATDETDLSQSTISSRKTFGVAPLDLSVFISFYVYWKKHQKYCWIFPVMWEGGLWKHDGRRLECFHMELSHWGPPRQWCVMLWVTGRCPLEYNRCGSCTARHEAMLSFQSVEWKVEPGTSLAVGLHCLGECRPVTWVIEVVFYLVLGCSSGIELLPVCGLTSKDILVWF